MQCLLVPGSTRYGSNITGFTKNSNKKIVVIENKVFWYIFGAPKYTQNVPLRREKGASSMEGRIMEGVIIKYFKYVKGEGSNDLLRKIAEDKLNKKKKRCLDNRG